ncbi:MAG: hypothetical protein WDN26_11830 [Chitinophagaceae bacterium]
MEKDIFDIEFDFDNKHYKGWINPSDKTNEQGTPVSYHVVLNEVSFGYLSFQNCKWSINEERPAGLVASVGKEIEKHFRL